MRVTVKDTAGVPVDSWSDYYPFGKEARGSSTSNEPKEQFTGKERDAETGLDYFGARYYNSEIGRWLAVDPLSSKYPSWTPYVYSGNNPVNFYDVDGKWWNDVHNEINKAALSGLFWPSEIDQINTESLYQDIFPWRYEAEEHFDSEQLSEGWKFVEGQLDKNSLSDLGKGLHALQDFYTHSNYVEVATEFFGDGNVPTYDEAIKNSEFEKVWSTKGTSGYYPDSDTPQGKQSHSDLEVDKKDTPKQEKHQAGKKLAIEHSKKYATEWVKRRENEKKKSDKDEKNDRNEK